MDPLSKCYPSSPSSIKPSSKALILISNCFPRETQNSNHATTITTSAKFFPIELRSVDDARRRFPPKPHLPLLGLGLAYPFPCLAADEPSSKIDLESVLVSIDNFFNRYPFFVATVAFIWLVVIPLAEEYLQKYKFVSAINAFKKLQNDPNCQLLDVRDGKSAAYLSPPNLKMLNKSAVRAEYREGEYEEDGFLKSVLENFKDPANTSICVIDSFDGNSMKVAELLVKNGFKEAYAVRGGILGKNGWQEIQEELLPPSVHVFPKKKMMSGKSSEQLKRNGSVFQDESAQSSAGNSSAAAAAAASRIEKDRIEPKGGDNKPLSPYPSYPDFKPPSSPTPSKPK